MNMLDKTLEKLGLMSALGYIFFSVIPYAIAGKHICTGIMLITFIVLLLRKQIRNIPLGWLSISLYLVLGLAVLSVMLSPYAVDSLNQLRKDGLPFLLAFLMLINVRQFDRTKMAVCVMLSLMLGYAVKEVLALWAGATNGFQFSLYLYESPDVNFPKYLDFFSADTPYYLPFLLGPLCFWPMKLWQRFILLFLIMLAIAVVVVSGVRTAFVFVVATTLLMLLYRLWNLRKTLLAMVAVLIFGVYLLKGHISNPSVARYMTIASLETYKLGQDASVSERYAIIQGVWEVSKDRLLVGYGPGWKKLPVVAEVNGHMERWRSSDEPIDERKLRYFSLGEGRVNPHNLYIGLLFEFGLLGLAAYMSLISTVAIQSVRLILKTSDPIQRGIGVAVVLYMMVYFGGSIVGGAWLPVTMLVAVVCLALSQQNVLESN